MSAAARESGALTLGYGGAPVLRDVDLDVPAGSIVALSAPTARARRPCCGRCPAWSRPRAAASASTGRTCSGVSVEDRVRRGLAHVPRAAASSRS